MLPNNGNVIMSAEQAAEHASKTVRVIPTRSLQAGLAALVAFDAAHDAEANAEAMAEAVASVATGAVTVASRDVELNGVAVRKGEMARARRRRAGRGAATSFDEVARAVLERLLAEPRGVLTLLTGEDPPALDALLARARGARIRSSSSTCTRADSRTTRCSLGCGMTSREPPIRVVLVEDNDTFRETLELLFGMRRRRSRSSRASRRATRRPRSCAS